MLQPDKLKKLNENALKMHDAGKSEAEILEMKDAFIAQFGEEDSSKKKSQDSGSTSVGQKSASAQKTGSLDGQTTTKNSSGFPEIDTNTIAPGMGVQPQAEQQNPIAKENLPKKPNKNTKPVETEEVDGFFGGLMNRLDTGIASVSKSFYDAPKMILDAIYAPQNYAAEKLNIPSLKVDPESYAFDNIPSKQMDSIINTNNKNIENYKKEIGGDVVSAYDKGDYGNTFKHAALNSMESVPLMAAAMATGGESLLANSVMIGSSASTQYDQLNKEHPEMSTNKKLANAAVNGALEVVVGKFMEGVSGNVWKNILKSKGVEGTAEIATNSFKKSLEKVVGKSPIVGVAGEYAEERITDGLQQLNDIETGASTEFNWDQNKNAGLSSLGFGLPNATALYGAKAYISNKTKNQVTESTKQIMKLQNDLQNSDLSTENKKIIADNISKIYDKNKKILGSELEKLKIIPQKERKELLSIDQSMSKAKSDIIDIKHDSNITDENKALLLKNLEEDYKKDMERKNEILSKNSPIEFLPLKEQEKFKRQALQDLTSELNPDGKKDMTITDEQITKRANKLYAASKNTEQEKNTTTEKEKVNLPLNTEQTQETGKKEEVNLPPQETIEPKKTVKESLKGEGIYYYDGEKGTLSTDGQQVVFETKNKIKELGNIDEISDSDIKDLGLEQEQELNISLNNDNHVEFNGKTYKNNYSNPESAFSKDKDGNYSVTLDAENGQKRTFRGQQADQIVYQYKLKNFENNATEEQITRAHELADEAIGVEEQTGQSTAKEKTRSSGKNKRTLKQIKEPLTKIEREALARENATETSKEEKPATTTEKQEPAKTEIPKVSEKKQSVRERLVEINNKVFGLKSKQSEASTAVMEKTVETMAKRSGISPEEMMDKIEFRKGDSDTAKKLSERGKALFQVIGQNAKLSENVKNSLNTAKEMEKSGKNKREIFDATGWQKGIEKKWKYDLQEGEFEIKNKKNGKLKDVIHYPRLLKKYPNLGNVKVVFKDVPAESRFVAAYNKGENSITVNSNLKGAELNSATMHEIQHWIQVKEGFAGGGSPMSARNSIFQKVFIKQEEQSQASKLVDKIKSKFGYDITEKVPDDQSLERKEKLKGLLQKSDFKLYESIAGEVEARNVQDRLNMTEEQRKTTPLEETESVDRDEQIILFQGEKGAMLAEDGKYIIYALTDPNVSTPLHEMAHVYEHFLDKNEKATILKDAGHTTWSRETSEHFAKSFEKYLADGIAPNPEMKTVFENFQKWLTDIYKGLKNSDIDIKISPQMKKVFDSMLGEENPSKQYKRSENGLTYTVTPRPGEKLDIRDEKGNEPSHTTRTIVEGQYADEFDFTKGKTAPEATPDNPNQHVLDHSENPSEIASTIVNYDNKNSIENNIDYKDSILADGIGKVKEDGRSGFNNFGDRKHVTPQMRKNYFSEDGADIDTLAQELSERAGVEITPEDVVDFITEHPEGTTAFYNKIKEEQYAPIRDLKTKFTELTGLPASTKNLVKAIEQFVKKQDLEKRYTSLDYYSDEQLSDIYKEKKLSEKEHYGKENGTIGSTESANEARNSNGNEKESSVREEGNGRLSGETSDKSKADEILDWLDKVEKELDDFGKENLSSGIPIVMAKVAVKAMRTAVLAGKKGNEILQAGIDAVKKSEWFKNLTKAEQSEIESDFQTNFMDKISNPKELEDSFEIQDQTAYEKTLNNIVRKFQDHLVDVRNLQKGIEKFTGVKARKDTNFDQAEVAMHGRAANDLENFEKEVKDLGTAIGKAGLTSNQVSDYMYANHAKERNAFIKENIDPEKESGSGMSDEKADEILAEFSPAQVKNLDAIAKQVYDIIESTRKTYEKFGLESPESVQALRDQYENYVPLTGFAEDEKADSYLGSSSNSISIDGKENKRASGRGSKADNVIANVIKQHTDAILRGRKNEVLQKLYNLASENKNNAVWKIFSEGNPDFERKFVSKKSKSAESESNEITDMFDEDNPSKKKSSGAMRNVPIQMKNNDKYVGVKVNGNQHYIKFENENLAKSLNGASIQKSSLITKLLGPINRYLSKTATGYNPEFIPTNALRDVQTALYNLMAEKDISKNSVQGKEFVSKAVTGIPSSARTIYQVETGKKVGNAKIEKYYNEFKEDGAKTGWAFSQDPKEIKANVDHFIKLQQQGLNTAKTKESFNGVLQFVDNVNSSIENATRLSTYIAARESGVTREDAGELAKELTVNFNKKGEYGAVANSLYLFFNAGIQGTARFAKAMGTLKQTVKADGTTKKSLNKAQKLAMGTVVFSGLLTLLNQAGSEDDEDGKSYYSKIPDWEKERNMIIMLPNGKEYLKVPLPYGYNIFNNIGTMIAEVSAGERTKGNAAGFLVNAMVGAFSPVGLSASKDVEKSILKTVTPTSVRPMADMAVNENFFGNKIHNENFPLGAPKPDSELGRKNTPKAYENVSKFLNKATGGSEFRSGAIDWNPDNIKYLMDFAIGGTGTFAGRTLDTAKKVADKAQGEDVNFEYNKIPFVRRFIGEPENYGDKTTYYDRKTELSQIYKEYQNVSPKEKKDKIYDGIKELQHGIKYTDKKLKNLKEKSEKAEAIKDPKAKKKELDRIEKESELVVSKFNKLYDKLRKGQ